MMQEELRPNGQRSKIAIIIIYVIIGLQIISFISDYFQYDLLQAVDNGHYISMRDAEANDTRQRVVGVVLLIFQIISCVTFIRWFRRAYFNLHLRADNLSYPEGWAAGSWFVPIISLFRPLQIMKELFNKTDNYIAERSEGYERKSHSRLLGFWWTLWITSNILGNIIMRTALKADTVKEMLTMTSVSMIEAFIDLPLALITINLILCYRKKEITFHSIAAVVPEENSEMNDTGNPLVS